MNEPVDERPLEGHLAPADVVGGEAAGWKAALGGERARALGLRGPLVGRLVTDRVFESGATISVSGWASARVEPETAVRLGRDVPPDADEQAIWDCVAAVLPAFELVDVTAGFDDVEAMLRTNIYHRAVVVGAPADPAILAAGPVTLLLVQDGEIIAESADADAAVGGIRNVVAHIADVLAHSGEILRAGELLMTGTVIAPPHLEPGSTYAADFGALGTVRVRIEPS
ncbi:MAG TPA: fumarylacetoacetate hydrolase family protein [Microbacterium sp.]|jgi:2-keto-4-pentenoate hydratase|nr:fumarylacetoacetate hydrolase family protein [Microbacterium sp.]